jgi:transcriptional regulator with XRE-family HTH domain
VAQNLPLLRVVAEGEGDAEMLQDTTRTSDPEEAAARDADVMPAAAMPADENHWLAGRRLTEARVARGLSLEEIAERIRVRREYLQALEDMNLKLLPGKAYALAFLRSYARELGLDDDVIVDQFQQESALSREDAQKQIRSPTSRPNRERPWLAAAMLAVVAAAFVGWRALDRERVEAPPPPEAAASPSPTVAPAGSEASLAAETPRVIEIKALADAWLEARGPDGTVFLSRTLRAGDVYRPDPSPGWTLHAHDGAAFEVFINGQSAGPLGNAGMPVLGRGIDGIDLPATPDGAQPRG